MIISENVMKTNTKTRISHSSSTKDLILVGDHFCFGLFHFDLPKLQELFSLELALGRLVKLEQKNVNHIMNQRLTQ